MIQGDINGREVVIGPKGQVTGTVTANEVKIDGQVSGALKASSVTLSSTARVDGDICHHRLAIAEGAQFDGSVRRPRDESEITPILDPETVKAQSD